MNETKKTANAKKWTNEIVSRHLYAMEEEIKEPGVYLLRHLLSSRRLSKHVWSYWQRSMDDELLDHMALIEGMLEVKIFRAGCKKEMPVSMVIWLLKYVHKWGNKE